MTGNKIIELVERAVDKDAPVLDRRTPLDSARLFIDEKFTDAEDSVRTLHRHKNTFYKWNGRCYPAIENEEIRAVLYDFLDGAKTEKGAPFSPNTAKVNEVIDALKATANLPEDYAAPCWLDETPDLPPDEILSCTNGLLHLPERNLLPPTPLFFSHNAVDYAYDPDALDPEGWLKFLDDLWHDDQDSIDTLQELFGYLLTPDTRQQKIFMLVGPKRSGKGTIGHIIRAMIGRSNMRFPTLASLGTNFGLAPLIGSLVAVITDARMGGRTDQRAIAERLLSISGEDAQTIDRKFRGAWTGTLSTRFLLLTNELPHIADASGALASRFIILRLTESFLGREDKGLTARLLTELPAILNWGILGWDRLQERGYFEQPESAKEAMLELEDLSSPIGAFIRDRCIIGPAEEVEAGYLFETWKTWCADQGRDRPGTRQMFGRDLRAAVPHIKTTNIREGDGRKRLYQGIGLK